MLAPPTAIRAAALLLLSSCLPLAAAGQHPPAEGPPLAAQDLKHLSIEELAELDVTSVSRRVERLSQTAAAVSVVRQEDIRRSGVTSLAEAVRLADGIDVARADGRTWSITARGFNISTANKLLVLMDGRTLYSPLFSGTFWDVQDAVMADVDRIEVIRGPGGTLWGANAVNGVINIITKDAADTRGNSAVLAAGTENEVIAAARHGARAAGGGSYRVFGKFRQFGANRFASGESADDAMRLGHLGFRYDSAADRASRWTFQANAYRGREGLFGREDTDVHGAFLVAGWSRRFSGTADFQLRGYFDRTYRRVPLQFEEGRNTIDVDLQQRLVVGGRHEIVAGGELRLSTARALGSAALAFEPEARTNHVAGVFVQDEMALVPDRLFLTLGAKAEGNDYTGLEVQPTARLRWRQSEHQTLWGAVSRAVRLPTRLDTDLRILNPLTGLPVIAGNPDFESESVIASEGGYRIRPHPRLSLDLAGFVNRYDSLRSQELPGGPGEATRLGNTLNAVTSGVEAAAAVQVLDRWRVLGSYALLGKSVTADAGSRDATGGASEGNDPRYFFKLRSYLDLPAGLKLDGFFRRVARRPQPVVPAYSELDLRLGWTVRPGWEVSLVGQNLLDASHPEFGAPQPRRHEFQRGVYVRTAWLF